MRTLILAAILAASPAAAMLTPDPTPEGLRIRERAVREGITYLILATDARSIPARDIRVEPRRLVFVHADTGELVSLRLDAIDLKATEYVATEALPRGLWLDEQTARLREVQIRPLNDAEWAQERLRLEADLDEARQDFREAHRAAKCGHLTGAAAQLCGLVVAGDAEARMGVIEKRVLSELPLPPKP